MGIVLAAGERVMCNASVIVRMSSRLTGACALALMVPAVIVHAQPVPGTAPAATASQPAPGPARDSLGRDTPRGTVLGFLNAARKRDDRLAGRYLNTTLGGEAAATLAQQLFVVLDARLPARLAEVSSLPEGSRANPLFPDQEVVGTIGSATGPVDIVLERVARGQTGPIWLVSTRTLESIPAVYEEIAAARFDAVVPAFLTTTRVFGVSLFEALAVLLLPVVYFLTVVLNRILTALLGFMWHRLLGRSGRLRDVLPRPARLLVLAITIRVLVSSLPLPLLVRQFWSQAANLVTIAAVVWFLLLVDGAVERYIRRRFASAHVAAAVSLLRLGRRMVDALVVFAGLLAALHLFRINLTPALAGLGVGGIAVALAAQKTLENVIAGGSLVFDRALAVGDVVKLGEIEGTVDHIGLRSTRIRTFDRTIVSVRTGRSRPSASRHAPRATSSGFIRPSRSAWRRPPSSCTRCSRASGDCWPTIGRSITPRCVSASSASAPSPSTWRSSPTSSLAIGPISSRFRNSFSSASPRRSRRPAPGSPCRRRRGTWPARRPCPRAAGPPLATEGNTR